MSKYDRDVKAYIIDNVSIVDVAGSRLSLERAGSSYKALCPFHVEKTPSFMVSEKYRSYRCFGCQQHGNVIDFVMNTENLGFLEAIEALAERYGLDISQFENKENKRERELDAKVFKMNVIALRFFRAEIKKSRMALDYLARRKLSIESINTFQLGYAPPAWTALVDRLRQEKYSDEDILNSGLVVRGKKGLIDRFRNRLMFPILDHRSRVLGFGARAFGDDKPKYLNSAEGRVFKKSNILYGEGFQTKSQASDYVILVEGYMDVIQLCQAGFTNVYASMGTALTENQAKKISHKAKKVYFAYDMDLPGRKAISKSIHLLEDYDLEVKVMTLTGAKDPDEFLLKFGKRAFENVMEKAIGVIRFRIDNIRQGKDLTKPGERLAFVERALEIIARELDELEAEIYLQELSSVSGVRLDTLISEFRRVRPKIKKKEAEVPKEEKSRASNSSSALKKELGLSPKASDETEERLNLLERQMLAYASYSQEYASLIFEQAPDFSSPYVVDLLSLLMVYYMGGEEFEPLRFAETSDQEKAQAIIETRELVYGGYAEEEARILFMRWNKLLTDKKLKEIDLELENLNFSDSETAEVEKRRLRERRKNLLTNARKNMRSET